MFCKSCGPEHIIHTIMASVLFLWWVFGILVVTFKEPFRNACYSIVTTDDDVYVFFTANGNFSTWIAAILATLHLQAVFLKAKELCAKLVPKGPDGVILGGLFIASLTEMVQAAYDCGSDDCTSAEGWGVA